MPNFDPIYGKVYKNPRLTLTTGFATYTGADATLLFTADSTSGSKLVRLIANPRGTNTASVLRIFKALGGTNFVLIREVALVATSASSTVAAVPLEVPLNLGLELSGEIHVQLATTVAGGWDIMAEAMDY